MNAKKGLTIVIQIMLTAQTEKEDMTAYARLDIMHRQMAKIA